MDKISPSDGDDMGSIPILNTRLIFTRVIFYDYSTLIYFYYTYIKIQLKIKIEIPK